MNNNSSQRKSVNTQETTPSVIHSGDTFTHSIYDVFRFLNFITDIPKILFIIFLIYAGYIVYVFFKSLIP